MNIFHLHIRFELHFVNFPPPQTVYAACCRAGWFNGLVSWRDDATACIYMWKCAFMCVRLRVRFTPFNYYCIKVFRLICSFRIYFVKVFSYKRHVLTIIITHTYKVNSREQKGKCSCASLHGGWCETKWEWRGKRETISAQQNQDHLLCALCSVHRQWR